MKARAVRKAKSFTTGFTIVELLIVIVVIAILAAVTAVAYQGVSNSAHNRSVQAYLNQILKKIELARVESGFQFMRYTSAETGTLGEILRSVPLSEGIDTTKDFPVVISHGGYNGEVMLNTIIRAYSKSGEILTAYPDPGGARVVYESSKEAAKKSRQDTIAFWQDLTYAECVAMFEGTCPIGGSTEAGFNQYKADMLQGLQEEIANLSAVKTKWPDISLVSCPDPPSTALTTSRTRLGHDVACYTYTDNGDIVSYIMSMQAYIMYSSAQHKYMNVVLIAS